MTEIWKPVIDWERWYEVSDHGNVGSVDRWITYSDGRKGFYTGKILKQFVSGSGYLSVNLSMGGNHKMCKVHRLVGLAFIDKDWTEQFDHIDLNKLNNVVSNLRVATRSQNQANSVKLRGVSKYKGVYFDNRRKRNPWSSGISMSGKTIHLGTFPTQEQAASAYNKAALEHFGEFARTNEI